MGVDIAELAQALASSQPLVYLSDGSDEGGSIDIPVEAPDNDIADILSLRQIMTRLDTLDRLLLDYRYYRGMTQTQTAKLLNMTQVQVSRREKKLLEAIRAEMLGW